MNINLTEKDINGVEHEKDGSITFLLKTKRKAEAVGRCYDRNDFIFSDALQGENKTIYIYAILHNSYKYCNVKLR